ncbi:MAG: release factor glutamine methyltransferase [Cryptosporangiaceae bacterium]|nr:release factor glutamine methyltransferase [Cryptosporangiaceae bacterium]
MDYEPTLNPEDAERIRAWHERAYAETLAAAAPGRTVSYLGLDLAIPPTVHPINPMSDLLGDSVLAEVRPGERVLDMGTGSGVNGILAATRGADVLAVDVNPDAVAAARENAERNQVTIRTAHSDVFSHVDGRFDVIVFDPPFRWFAARDLLEGASTDENYRALTEFFASARDHLTEAGRMLIMFGTTGDLGYLHRLIDEHGFTAEPIAERGLNRDGIQVRYVTFRVTPRATTQ